MKAEELAIFYEDFSAQQAGFRDGLLGSSPALPSLHQCKILILDSNWGRTSKPTSPTTVRSKLSVIGRKFGRTISEVSAVLLPLAIWFCDPRSGLGDIVVLGLLLELSRFPHYLPGAVFEGFGPFAFLAVLLTCGQFALCHEPSLPHAGRLGYPVDYKLPSSEYLIRIDHF